MVVYVAGFREFKPAPEAEVNGIGVPLDEDNYQLVHDDVLVSAERILPSCTEGLKLGVYSFAEARGITPISWRGFWTWCDWLAHWGGHKSPKHIWDGRVRTGPFVELIKLSAIQDCYIGPTLSAKLAKDFREHQARVGTNAKPWPASLCPEYLEALEMAADGGVFYQSG